MVRDVHAEPLLPLRGHRRAEPTWLKQGFNQGLNHGLKEEFNGGLRHVFIDDSSTTGRKALGDKGKLVRLESPTYPLSTPSPNTTEPFWLHHPNGGAPTQLQRIGKIRP
ncbi:hypothetical protein GCM10009800_21610 [Nocardiopsis rhodophaea]